MKEERLKEIEKIYRLDEVDRPEFAKYIRELIGEVRSQNETIENLDYANGEWKISDALWKESIQGIVKTADVIDAKNQELFSQIAEKDKEIRWLREERDMLESKVQQYRGYE